MPQAAKIKAPTNRPAGSLKVFFKKADLVELSELATKGKLEEHLVASGVAEFSEASTPTKRKRFSELKPFNRSEFDYEAYSAQLEQALQKG